MSVFTDTEAITIVIAAEADLLKVRGALRSEAVAVGMGLTPATKLVAAGSELARNIVRYATHSQGEVLIDRVTSGDHDGIRAVFTDHGPGIADLTNAMRDGFSSAGSLGLGLPGSRRLVDEFSIDTEAGRGTTVVITQWRR